MQQGCTNVVVRHMITLLGHVQRQTTNVTRLASFTAQKKTLASILVHIGMRCLRPHCSIHQQ